MTGLGLQILERAVVPLQSILGTSTGRSMEQATRNVESIAKSESPIYTVASDCTTDEQRLDQLRAVEELAWKNECTARQSYAETPQSPLTEVDQFMPKPQITRPLDFSAVTWKQQSDILREPELQVLPTRLGSPLGNVDMQRPFSFAAPENVSYIALEPSDKAKLLMGEERHEFLHSSTNLSAASLQRRRSVRYPSNPLFYRIPISFIQAEINTGFS